MRGSMAYPFDTIFSGERRNAEVTTCGIDFDTRGLLW